MARRSARKDAIVTNSQPADEEKAPPTSFDEHIYLHLYPDVRMAVAAGAFRSGQDHYARFGRREGRSITIRGDAITNKMLGPTFWVEKLEYSPSGGLYILGWVNDQRDPIVCIDLEFPNLPLISIPADHLARFRRTDVEAVLSLSIPHEAGFWSFFRSAVPIVPGRCKMTMRTEAGAISYDNPLLAIAGDDEVRITVLSQLGQANYLTEQSFGAIECIDPAIGSELVEFNQTLTRRAAGTFSIESFGRTDRAYQGSIIVHVYGNSEYLYLQQAIFSRQLGIEDYEFIYVCTSPELAQGLLEEARLSSLIYNLDVTLILFDENIGFAAANNLAAEHARSERLLFTNPDVFPRGPNWVRDHTTIVTARPRHQTAIFGAPLYYDNGAVMHGGVYFDLDTSVKSRHNQCRKTEILQIKPYGKGAPPDTPDYLRSRPVPAVNRAFISIERSWFEKLSGFSRAYIFGDFEGADLCLRSLVAGTPVWVHDVKLYHLEGKVFSRHAAHEGGSIMDHWLFTKIWKDVVVENILGPTPLHPALRSDS